MFILPFFFFLHLSCNHSSNWIIPLKHNSYFLLRHPSLGLGKALYSLVWNTVVTLFWGLSTSSLTLPQKAQPFLSGRYSFYRELHLDILISSYPASSLFGTQHYFTHPPVRKSTFPLGKMSVSQGDLLDILFSYYSAFALLGLVFTHITH